MARQRHGQTEIIQVQVPEKQIPEPTISEEQSRKRDEPPHRMPDLPQ